MNNELKNFYLSVARKYSLCNSKLEEFLSLIKEKSVFIDDMEERILYDKEIINYKENFQVDLDVILLVDIGNNDFVAFNLNENKFQLFNVVDKIFFQDVDIDKYLKKLKEY